MVDSASSKPVMTTKAVASHPKTMDMVVEALTTLKDRKGISVQAIKTYILTHYTTVSPTHLTSSLRRALKTGLESGMLVRPKDSHANGVSGRLRLGKLPQKPEKKSVNKTTPKKKAVKKTPKKDKKPKDK
ncbi:sperm-specific protein PHI-2B/PHI-3-like, partial [Saccoglossus kowalevskii]